MTCSVCAKDANDNPCAYYDTGQKRGPAMDFCLEMLLVPVTRGETGARFKHDIRDVKSEQGKGTMKEKVFIIRHRDRAIFERDVDGGLHCVKYVPARWWRRDGGFVRTGEHWLPFDKTEYDIVAREYVLEGCKMLEERKP